MKALRIGVIGAGSMGRNHVRILSEEKQHFDFAGFYDIDPVQAAQVQKQFHVTQYPSMQALMEDIEAVVIAVPSSLHYKIAIEAAHQKLHALVEKPLAITLPEAEQIANAFQIKNRKLAIGHVERFNPVVVELCKILQEECILALEIRRYSPFDGRITDADVVQDLMIHDIDLACNVLLQKQPCSIHAAGLAVKSRRLDFVQGLLHFPNGVIANISASCVTENKIREIVIHTTQSYIAADLLTRSLTITRNTNLVLGKGYESNYRQDSITQKIFVPMIEPLRAELLSFYAWITGEDTTIADGEAACKAIAIGEKIAGKAYQLPASIA